MTPDELEYLILEAADARELQTACENLDETSRAKLSSAAQKLYSQLLNSKAGAGASPGLLDFLEKHRTRDRFQYWNSPTTRRARLALFALGPLSVVKRSDFYLGPEDQMVLRRIILDRRPAWLDDWIAHDLEREWHLLDFATLRTWIRSGVCAKPEVDGYYRMFASHLMRVREYGRDAPAPPLLSRQLLDDPGLLDDIPSLFRVENIAFNTNSWLQPQAGRVYETWPEALVQLSAQGHVERGRLFDLTLEGLTRDLKHNQLSGFHGLYRRLSPMPEELQRHQPRLIGLLCHPVGHVAKFAIEMLADIEKRGALDAGAVLREMPIVLTGEGKGNAVASLKLIGRILARRKDDDPKALSAVCEALRHANADVQGQALALLEANAARLDATQRAVIGDAAQYVAATNRDRAMALAGEGGASAAPASDALDATTVAPYQPISDDINQQTVLADEDRIRPIATTDELLGAIRHAIEVVDSPDEVERIVDAISRLAGDWPLGDLSAPVLHRLKNPRGATKGLVASYGSTAGLALLDLIYTWLTGRLHRTRTGERAYYVSEDAFAPMAARLGAIAERVSRRLPCALLSAPTHKGGWIDPLVWVERLRAVQGQAGVAESLDLRLSLLRLAPDNRTVALARSADLVKPLRRIAGFALGGDERPERADRANYATWITAARCRGPHEDWSKTFASLGLDDEWPDGLRPARYTWRAFHEKDQSQQHRWKHPKFDIRVATDRPNAPAAAGGGLLSRIGDTLGGRVVTDWAAMPAAAMNRRPEAKHYWAGDLHTVWMMQWLVQLWPQNPDPAYMKAAARLTDRVDEAGSSWSPNYGAFHGLFQKNRPWGEAGHLLLCLGLVGKDADAKGLAVDALIEGIEGRLFDPGKFAATMTGLAKGEWLKFNRLGDGLALAVTVSPGHATVVAEALQRWLPTLDLQQNGAFRMLEVLAEAQAITRAAVDAEAKAALRRLTGGGKAAKLARRLLAA